MKDNHLVDYLNEALRDLKIGKEHFYQKNGGWYLKHDTTNRLIKHMEILQRDDYNKTKQELDNAS